VLVDGAELGAGGGSSEYGSDEVEARKGEKQGEKQGEDCGARDEDGYASEGIAAGDHGWPFWWWRSLPGGGEDGCVVGCDLDDAAVVDNDEAFVIDRGEGLSGPLKRVEALPCSFGVL